MAMPMEGQQQEQAGPEQQGGQAEAEVAKLFQNVGQGLVLINQYVAGAVPDLRPMAEEIIQGYEQLVSAVSQARQGGGQSQAGGPRPQEAGAAETQQAF